MAHVGCRVFCSRSVRIRTFRKILRTYRGLGDDLSRFTCDLRAWLAAISLGQADPAEAVDRAVGAVGLGRLAGYVRSSYAGDDITLILRSLTERLRHVMPGAQDWAQAFADVEAADAVTLMTIHRSKGLEYHTVFFLGLDDDQWWAYERDADEATSAFFVGLSRAAHRLIFTSTNPAARSGKIAVLHRMLDEAGGARNPRTVTIPAPIAKVRGQALPQRTARVRLRRLRRPARPESRVPAWTWPRPPRPVRGEAGNTPAGRAAPGRDGKTAPRSTPQHA